MKDELDGIRQQLNDIDRDMARLFEHRMQLGARVADYKYRHKLPILDTCRQFEVLQRNSQFLADESIKDYYADFQQKVMELTRGYEADFMLKTTEDHSSEGTFLTVRHSEQSYDVVIERGALAHIADYINLERKVLVVSDDGVPTDYWKRVLEQSGQGFSLVFPAGEKSKDMQMLNVIISQMVRRGFTRSDAVVAVGGGVVGDLAGFAAATYMRGIDFYNIPTTLLAQVDASIGGKTAVNFDGIKNVVGSFYQPAKVIIDTNTLRTLDRRLFREGLVEALKMAATFSRLLFDKIRDSEHIEDEIDTIVAEALRLKKRIIEEDPYEQRLRRVLNFGHTVGHAIETASEGEYCHGECVGMGMLFFCSSTVRAEIRAVLEKYGLPTRTDISANTLMSFVGHDKKRSGDVVNVVYVNEIGKFELKSMDMASIKELICARQNCSE